MISEEHFYAIALRKCNQIGDIHFHQLVQKFGTAKQAWKRAKQEYKNLKGIGQRTVADIGNKSHLEFAESELRYCEKNNIQIYLKHLKETPPLLNECNDAPAILYQKGKIDHTIPKVSIVGTRNMTEYGRHFIEIFFNTVQSTAFTSVSDLAFGIDKEVHEQSLRTQKPTVAVLAHGSVSIPIKKQNSFRKNPTKRWSINY